MNENKSMFFNKNNINHNQNNNKLSSYNNELSQSKVLFKIKNRISIK